jgi:hypothetical protein
MKKNIAQFILALFVAILLPACQGTMPSLGEIHVYEGGGPPQRPMFHPQPMVGHQQGPPPGWPMVNPSYSYGDARANMVGPRPGAWPRGGYDPNFNYGSGEYYRR